MNEISKLLEIDSDWPKKTSFKHNKGQRGFTRRRVRRHVKFTRIFGFGREDACCNLYNNSCSTLLSFTTYYTYLLKSLTWKKMTRYIPNWWFNWEVRREDLNFLLLSFGLMYLCLNRAIPSRKCSIKEHYLKIFWLCEKTIRIRPFWLYEGIFFLNRLFIFELTILLCLKVLRVLWPTSFECQGRMTIVD